LKSAEGKLEDAMMEIEKCKEKVYNKDGAWGYKRRQCSRNAWKDGYCKIHHSESVIKRQLASEKRWEEKKRKESWYLLIKANDRIKELELEIKMLKEKEMERT